MKGFLRFVRTTGIPDLIEGATHPAGTMDVSELGEVAAANKLQPLLARDLGSASVWQHKYTSFLGTVSTVADLLSDLNYAIVKTVLPVPHLPSDVDVLVDPECFEEALERLAKRDFKYLDKCPYGSTLHDNKTGFNVDLSQELTVAGLKYIGRDLVLGETVECEVNETKVRVPRPHIDLLVIIDHSVFKEWIYTLRDFYTSLLWLKHLPRTISLAYSESDATAVQLFLTVTHSIFREAFGKEQLITKEFAKMLRTMPNDDITDVPYRYRYMDLARAYISKAGYFSRNGILQGAAKYALTAKTLRLFTGFLLRKAY